MYLTKDDYEEIRMWGYEPDAMDRIRVSENHVYAAGVAAGYVKGCRNCSRMAVQMIKRNQRAKKARSRGK